MKRMNLEQRNYKRITIAVCLMLLITLLTPMICFAAPDISGVLDDAGQELGNTVNDVPSAAKPIFYIVVGLAALTRIAFLVKEWFQHRNDDRESKQITNTIIATVAIAIGIAVFAPFLVKLINVIFGTHFNF